MTDQIILDVYKLLYIGMIAIETLNPTVGFSI